MSGKAEKNEGDGEVEMCVWDSEEEDLFEGFDGNSNARSSSLRVKPRDGLLGNSSKLTRFL